MCCTAMSESEPSTPGARHTQLTVGYGTDRGMRRELNEDSVLSADPLFAVADGMGGHEAGEVASGLCVQVMGSHQLLATKGRQLTTDNVQDIIADADAAIREVTESRAGTTLSGVVLVEDGATPCWLVFNVGDSRTYRLKTSGLEQISVDHSEVQELVDMGRITEREAMVHPRRNVVTMALGTGPKADPDFILLPVEDGDRMLICSDGLTGEVSKEQIERIMDGLRRPQDIADSLIQAALRAGGRDNVTVVVVEASV